MESRRRIVPDDLTNFRFVHDPNISKDGKQILFTVSQVKDSDEYSSAVWKYTGEKCNPVIDSMGRAFNPIWSPDGSNFLFLTSRKDKFEASFSEIWISNQTGSEKRKVCSIKSAKITDPKWSPLATEIFFLSDYCGDIQSEQPSDVRVITRRLFRFDGKGYQHDRRTHVFRISLIDSQIKRITSGEFDVVAYDVSADGSKVAVVCNKSKDADFENGLDIYSLDLKSGEWTSLFRNKGTISSIAYSPDGNFLSFIGHDYRFKFNTPLEVWTLDVSTKQARNVSKSLDRAARNSVLSDVSMDKWFLPPLWSSTSDKVYFLATDRGRCGIFVADIHSNQVKELTSGQNCVTSLSVSSDGTIAFVRTDPTSPPELFLLSGNNGFVKQITDLNLPLKSRLELSQPSDFEFTASDGTPVHGFFYPPLLQSKNTGPPPCVIEIHGGGGTEGFQFMHEFQCLAALGFAVLTCNFRGTQGYGEDFMRVLSGHYMEKDYSDIIEMIKHAIEKGWIDAKRVGVTGGSYGGYLTNWAISHDGELFAAAVTDRSVVNLYSFYGTTDGYRLIEEDVQMSFPWDKPAHYLDKSPISHTKNVRTPLLIIHSEQDYRCPIEQAYQLYSFLKRQGKEVVLVEFPGESHGLSWGGKPHHRIERLKFDLWWFSAHIDSGFKSEPPVNFTGIEAIIRVNENT